jgi:CzcA family heavy metal efflux pump
MMRWIVESCLRFRLLVFAAAAAILVVGFAKIRSTPVDVLPEFTPPSVEIQTEALGLSAAEVEQLVTVPLEADLLNGVAWLDEIRSESVSGLSSIELIFEPGTDVLRARQMVQERLTQAHALPHVSKPPVMLQPLSSSGRVMMIGLSSKDLSLIDMSVLARWRIKPRLMGVPGVANVAIWGQRERQLQVQVDPELLRQNGVSLNQIITTTGNALWVSPLTFVEASTPGTGGFIDTPNQRLPIRHVLPITTPRDLAQVTVDETQAKPLRLGDVAQVVEDHQPLIGDAVVDGGPGLILVVEKFPGANTLQVTRDIEAALHALAPGLSGVRIDTTVFRPATFIERAIDNLAVTLLVGLVLVIALLGAVFFGWRSAAICLVAVVLSLAAAVLVLQLRGTPMNAVILAGLVVALGVLIDDAVGDTEHIKRRLRERPSDRSAAATVVEAVMEMRAPLAYATLIVLAVTLPVFLLTGLTGAFARPAALSYLLAVLAAMGVALVVTPALALTLLASEAAERRESPLKQWLRRGYGAVLPWALRGPGRALFAAAVLVAGGLALLLPLRAPSLLPPLQDRNLLIHWDGTPGTSWPEMVRITGQASTELRAIPGVRDVGAHVGRAVTSDQVVGVNSGEIWVSIAPAADYEATVSAIQRVVDGYPGFDRDVRTYPEHRTREASTGSGDDLVVRVFGQDLATLRGKAEEVQQLMLGVTGVVEPHLDLQAEEPTVEIEVDLVAAQRFGIKPGDVRRAAATLLSGLEVGNLFEQQKVFDVVVRGAPATRHSLTSIQELLIDTPDGGHVRLKDVAKVRVASNPNVIKHDGVSRRIDVSANVRGRDVDSVVRDIRSRLTSVSFPVEYHAEVLGGYAERAGARQRMLTFAIAAAIAVFLLLQAAFGSWRLAALVVLTLPVALVGGVVAAFASGGVVSLGSVIGLFAVLALAVRHAILLISRYQRLERDDGEPLGPALILRGAQERAVPVLTTTFAVALVLAPILVFGAIAGHEVLAPLAVVVLGGLVTAALLNLFILPVLYLSLGARRGPAAEGESWRVLPV